MSDILSCEGISKSFDDKKILSDVSIHLEKGEIVGLLGVSGAGKTTLFNILSGVSSPDEGRVFLSGNEITSKPGSVSYMLQKDLLFEYKKVIDNVSLPLRLKGMKKKEAREKANEFFELFGLDGYQKKYPGEMSGGMRQRAALLRTYLASSGVALLDEPFSALDSITKTNIHKWYLDVMRKIDLSTIFITHDIDEAIVLADRIYILSGTPGTITKEIKINEKKPRDVNFNLTEEFLEYKRDIVLSMHI